VHKGSEAGEKGRARVGLTTKWALFASKKDRSLDAEYHAGGGKKNLSHEGSGHPKKILQRMERANTVRGAGGHGGKGTHTRRVGFY